MADTGADLEENTRTELVENLNNELVSHPYLQTRLPLSPTGHDLADKLADGLILCVLVDQFMPATISSENIKAGDVLSSEDQLKNCALFVDACMQIGIDLRGLEGADIYCKRKTTQLEEIIWDVIAAAILN
mmetsp:Transcript_49660/g.124851  ORF Transcript_49660/g.124851 Transcript_49660/m.124851 type:complete len:131 (+) Transcript_49660:83-475(+)